MNAGPKQVPNVHYKSDVQKFMEDPRGYWSSLSDNQRLVLFTVLRMALVFAFPALVGPMLEEALETVYVEYKTPEHLAWIYEYTNSFAWLLLYAFGVLFVCILYLARGNKQKAVKDKEVSKGLNTPMQWLVSLAMVLFSLAHTVKVFADHVGQMRG